MCSHASVIRVEQPEDVPEVDEVIRAAFTDHGDQVVEFADRIRASPNAIPEYSLVAEEETSIVGHVMLSWVALEESSQPRILVLTPLSVRPDRQRRGIGTALVRAVLERADAAGEPAVLLEGIPGYYPRFGFERASAFGFVAPSPTIPDEAFMVRRLAAYVPSVAGRLVYPPAYDALASP
jgi:putative acetyltransferase